MSNRSVFKNPKLKAQKSSRNSFDLGHKFVFNTSLGEIVPCCVLDVPAGSYVELGCENQTYNFNPLVRPTFTRLKEHIDYFAVPKVQLWSLYDNFITGQSQYMSSALGASFLAGSNNLEEVPQQVPMFDGKFLMAMLEDIVDTSNPFGLSELNDTLKLLNYLGYGNFYKVFENCNNAQDVDQAGQYVINNYLPENLFALLAYQKVYFSYFRNSKYETNIPTAYNIDWLPKSKLNLTDTDYVSNDFKEIFKLRHRWLNKDYFMSVTPSILPTTSDIGFSGLSASIQASTSITDNTIWQVFSLPGMPNNRNIYATSTRGVSNNSSGFVGQNQSVTNNATTNSVAAIRFAFAYDKLLRRMRTAGATFDDQMLAQFGIKPVDYRHGDAYYLGGYTNRLNVSEVVDTSSADINSLGQFGANISKYSVNKRKISYHAKEDVIILGMYSTSYDVDYASSRYNKMNLKKYRFDFYNPAFENLGKQAIYSGELSMIADQVQPNSIPSTAIATKSDVTNLIGYQNRYLEYKTKIDTIAGICDFANNNASSMAWTTQYRPFNYTTAGVLETRLQEPLCMPMMLVNPIVMDDIVTTNYSTAWENDHFLINMYNDCKMVANMSIDGEIY